MDKSDEGAIRSVASSRSKRLVAYVVSLCLLIASVASLLYILLPSSNDAPRPHTPTREDASENFAALEEKIATATKRAKRSVVRISWVDARRVEHSLSGVILTADGYVATYAFYPFSQAEDLPLGRELFVHLSDGRKVPGVATGSAPDWGFGLVKITQEGVWPQAEAVNSADVAMGDVCIALSYAPDGLIPPSGVEIPQSQEASLRVGHVTMTAERRWLGTNCRLGGKDLGAGLFDLQGRLVGIFDAHESSTALRPSALHPTAEAVLKHWKEVAGRQRPNARQSQDPGDAAKEKLPSPDDPRLAGVVAKARQVMVGISATTETLGFSGVLVTPDGHIATCAHHGRPRGAEVKIHLSDGRSVPGTMLGSDPLLDIGLAKITGPGPWPYVEFGTTSSVKPGDICLALGYPANELDGSFKKNQFKQASLGVGNVRDTRLSPGILETSQPAFPGESGGGLFDSQGRLIGLHKGGRFPPGSLNYRVGIDLVKQHWDFLLTGVSVGDPGLFDEGPAAQAFRKVAGQTPPACVEVLGDGKRRCMGTILSEDGYILTKASELYGTVSCRLADGRVLPATVGKALPEHDLALLKIQASGLGQIRWRPNEQIVVGTFLGVTRFREPPAVGVASLAEHSVPRIPGWLVLGDLKDAQGGVEVRELRGIWQMCMPIRKGDVIVQVEGYATPNLKALEEVAKRDSTGMVWEMTSVIAGDPVRVTVRREGKNLDLCFPLLSTSWDQMDRTSPRRCAFPAVFETDATISKDSCGGPVVDRSGDVVGITISKAAEHRVYIIPAAIARKVFEQLRD